MKMRRLIIFLFCLTTFLPVFSQVIIEGKVKDVQNKPLSDIHVMVSMLHSDNIVGFNITTDEGQFRIHLRCVGDSVRIKTSSVSHEDFKAKIACKSQHLDIILKESVKDLKEITVKAKNVIKKGDTLSYLVKPFAREQDRTINEVIRRIPGIEVEPSGKILYEGTPISNLYVEGMDLMEDRYSLLTDNLPYDKVSTVEVITNHEPVKILQKYSTSGKVALNLRLRNKTTLTGNAELAGGIPYFTHKVNLTPILFQPTLQSLFSFQSNNSGEPFVETFGPMLTYQPNLRFDDPVSIPSPSPRNIPVADLPPKSYIDNSSLLTSAYILTRSTNQWEWRTSISYKNDKIDKNWSGRTSYLLPTDTLMFDETSAFTSKSKIWTAEINLRHNTEKYYADNRLSFSLEPAKQSGIFTRNSFAYKESFTEKPQKLDWNGRWIFPTRKKLIEVYSFIDYHYNPDLSLRTFPGYIHLNQTSDSVIQYFSGNRLACENYVSLYSSLKSFSLRMDAGFSYQRLHIESNLHSYEANFDFTGQDTNYWNDNVQKRFRIYFRPTLMKRTATTTWNFQIPLSSLLLTEESNIHMVSQNYAKIVAEPSLLYSKKIKNNWNVTASAKRYYQYFASSEIFYGYILASPDLLKKNEPLVSGRLYAVNHANATIKYNNIVTGFSAYGSVGYSLQQFDFLRSDSIGLNGSRIYTIINYANNRQLASLRGSISKSLPDVRTNFAINLNLQSDKGKVLVNGELNDSKTHYITLNPTIYHYFSVFDLVYAFRWLNIDTELGNSSQKQNSDWFRHELSITGNFSRKNLIVTASFIYNDLNKNRIFLTDLSIRYKIKKILSSKMETGLLINNLFDAGKYTYNQLGSYVNLVTEFPLRPFQCLLFVRFNY